MSQVKASPSAAPTQFSLHDQELHSSANRIMTRRASRSAQSQQHHPSVPLIVKTIADDENSVVPLDNDGSTAAAAETTTATTTTTVTAAAAAAADSDGGSHPRMATRSRSIDLNQSATSSAEESSSTTTPTPTSPSPNTAKQQQQQQQRRSTSTSTHHATTTSKTRAKKTRKRGVKASLSPTVASATSTKRGREERGSRRRNAKDTYNNTSSAGAAETTQLDAVKLQKLAELDELEKTVLDGTHAEYRERMAHAEKKRMHEMNNAKLRRDLEEADIRYTFDAFKKAAYDQFYQCKAELRKRMISRVQAQIKQLEEEWHACHENGCSDDDQELYDWVPSERQASIYFEPLGLNQEEILDDLATARKLYIAKEADHHHNNNNNNSNSNNN